MRLYRWSTIFKRDRTLLVVSCIVLSGFFWFSNRLSLVYHRQVTVQMNLTNLPKDKHLEKGFSVQINFEVKQQGYMFFKSYFHKNNVLDFNWLSEVSENQYTLSEQGKNALKNKYFPLAQSLQILTKTIHIPFIRKAHKVLPVIFFPFDKLQNQYQISDLTIRPDSVKVWGNSSIIDTLSVIYIENTLTCTDGFFEQEYYLKSSDEVQYQDSIVRIQGVVSKISEQEMQVPIWIKNVPLGAKVIIFPMKVKVLCTGSIHQLSAMKQSDIKVVADYSEAKNGVISLKIEQKPQQVSVRFLSQSSVEYLIEYK